MRHFASRWFKRIKCRDRSTTAVASNIAIETEKRGTTEPRMQNPAGRLKNDAAILTYDQLHESK